MNRDSLLAHAYAGFVRDVERIPGVWVPADSKLEVSYASHGEDERGPEVSYTLRRDGEYVTVESFGAWPLLKGAPDGAGV